MRLAEGQSIVNFSKVAHEDEEEVSEQQEGVTEVAEAEATQAPAENVAATTEE